jgi:hypothetical protein
VKREELALTLSGAATVASALSVVAEAFAIVASFVEGRSQ